MTIAITLALAVVPSWLLVRYFHERDLYPEPPRIIWGTFCLGALTIIPVLIVVFPAMKLIPQPDSHVLFGIQFAFLYAAIPEELFKLMVLLGFSFRQREFDEPMDGIVYGAVVSQGFAALENAMYSFSGGIGIAIARAFTAVPAHACMGVIMGYYVGRARFEPNRRGALIFTGFAAATLVHGLYDAPLMVINSIMMVYGDIPEEFAAMAGSCMLLGLAVLVASMAYARRLWKTAHREQIDHPMPPALPLALNVASIPPSPPAHPASIATPPPLRKATLVRHPEQTTGPSRLKLIAGIALSVFGGASLFACIQLILDSNTGSNRYMTLAFWFIFLGLIPLRMGLLLFRSGVRGLNAPPNTTGGVSQ